VYDARCGALLRHELEPELLENIAAFIGSFVAVGDVKVSCCLDCSSRNIGS
jgi:hypothetical protein